MSVNIRVGRLGWPSGGEEAAKGREDEEKSKRYTGLAAFLGCWWMLLLLCFVYGGLWRLWNERATGGEGERGETAAAAEEQNTKGDRPERGGVPGACWRWGLALAKALR
jgi:hypothetical protein